MAVRPDEENTGSEASDGAAPKHVCVVAVIASDDEGQDAVVIV